MALVTNQEPEKAAKEFTTSFLQYPFAPCTPCACTTCTNAFPFSLILEHAVSFLYNKVSHFPDLVSVGIRQGFIATTAYSCFITSSKWTVENFIRGIYSIAAHACWTSVWQKKETRCRGFIEQVLSFKLLGFFFLVTTIH